MFCGSLQERAPPVKFADKYELFEAVTTGRLETFKGRDASGENVLVHIFDAPVKRPDQPTVLWVLESFRSVAPEPPGLVIATGRYGSTSYAYLVTQVPEEAILRRWVEAYESSIAETREITVAHKIIADQKAPACDPLPPKAVDAAPTPPVQSASPPTGFFDLKAPGGVSPVPPPSPRSETAAPMEAASATVADDWEGIDFGPRKEVPSREPGEFTKQFLVASDERSASPAKVNATGRSVEPMESAEGSLSEPQEMGAFTAMFRPGFAPDFQERAESPNRTDNTPKVNDAKAGDFTRFFQGPFDGEQPAQIPAGLSHTPSTPRGKTPGEFTQMFGSGKDSAFAEPSPPMNSQDQLSPVRNEPGAFTRSFGEGGSLASVSEPAIPATQPKGNGSQKPPEFPEPKLTQAAPPAPPVKAAEPVVVPVVSPVVSANAPHVSKPSISGHSSPGHSSPGGATQLFSVPHEHSASSVPASPSGPSEYTLIISGGMAGAGASKQEEAAEPAAEAGAFPAIKMPAVPKMAAPPTAKLGAAAAAPKAPKLGALAPKAKSSSLAMIIILNVSLIVAVLLIVYFAIKH